MRIGDGQATLDFTSQGPVGIDHCLENIQSRVNEEMNSRLLRPFMEEEICLALSQMHPMKSPGPNGYSVVFYQKSWGKVGKEVVRAVLHFLNGGPFDAAINAMNISLITKVTSPTRVTDYRPISLCKCDLQAHLQSVSKPVKACFASHYLLGTKGIYFGLVNHG